MRLKRFYFTTFILALLCLGFSSCSKDDDASDDDWRGSYEEDDNQGGGSKEDGGSSKLSVVGNWYELSALGSHTLCCFRKDGTMEYSYLSSDRTVNYSWNYTWKVEDNNLLLTDSDGKIIEYEIKTLTKDSLVYGYNKMRKTALESLKSGSKPAYTEEVVRVKQYEQWDNGSNYVEIIPFFGVSSYTYSIATTAGGGTAKKGSGMKEVTTPVYELSRGTDYYLQVTPYDAQGNAFKPFVLKFRTGGSKGMNNYFVCQGKYYEVGSITRTTKRNSGSSKNYKHLTFYNSNSNYVQFTVAKYSWDGISSDWPTGTYKKKPLHK